MIIHAPETLGASPQPGTPCGTTTTDTSSAPQPRSIRRVDVLREMEVRENPDHTRRLYSIQYYKQTGEIVYYPHAYTCGLRASLKHNRLRGVQPCDPHGNPIGHIAAVSIDNIREWNGIPVRL